jgi:uncharacterized repeat protein (TIGR03843 family)
MARSRRPNPLDLPADDLHALLRHGEVLDCKELPWGSNYTFAVLLARAPMPETLAIYKPLRGEAPLWDFPSHTLYRREYAAWRFAELLGWDFIPPTVVRDGPYGIGSVQLYIEPDKHADYAEFADRYADQLQRIAVFDLVTNNADRKAGHCLLDRHGKLWGIDHGLTFNEDPKLRTVIWEFRKQPIPPALLADLRCLRDDPVRQARARRDLGAWLDPLEVEVTFRRLDAVLELGHFPGPSAAARNVPWPPY